MRRIGGRTSDSALVAIAFAMKQCAYGTTSRASETPTWKRNAGSIARTRIEKRFRFLKEYSITALLNIKVLSLHYIVSGKKSKKNRSDAEARTVRKQEIFAIPI